MIQGAKGYRARDGARGRLGARGDRRRERARRRLWHEPLEGRTLLAAQLSVGPLVNITRIPLNETEPAIAIDPSNPNRLFAGAIGGPAAGGQVGAYSTDGGATWQARVMSDGSDGTPVACCDATLSFDSFGNLFFGYIDLDNLTGVILLSTNGGQTFTQIADLGSMDQPTVITGPGDQPGTQSLWVTYNRNGQIFARGARITGLGQVGAFNAEQATGETGNYGDIMIGPNGQVFVAYQENAGGEGPTFISGNLDPDGLGPAGFQPKVRISSTNVGGFDYIAPQPDRSVDAEVGLAWDRNANSPNFGRLYAMYTDEEPNESDDTDIYLRYSDDNGATWSERQRVNDDTTTRSQFLPKIALDQTTGWVAISWLDARLDDGSNPLGDTDGRPNTDAILFATVTVDGGRSFAPNVQVGRGPSNQGPVAPPLPGFADLDYGDYLGLAFHGGKFYPIWPDNSAQMPGIVDRPNFDLATAAVSVIQLLVSPTPVAGAVENAALANVQVATFDSFNASDTPDEFTATIDWGDGQSSTGVISRVAGSLFRVRGSHTYQEGGDYTVLVTIDQAGVGSASASQIVRVANLPVFGTPVAVGGLAEGDTFSGVIATFDDTDLDPMTADLYTATILWTDDGTTSLGVIRPTGVPNQFEVLGDHVVGGGTSNVVVTIVGPGGVTAQFPSNRPFSTITATDSVLQSVGYELEPTEGTPLSDAAVAFFVDADPRRPPASNYIATIDWGDGSPLETGAIVAGSGVIGGQVRQGYYVYSSGAHVYDVPQPPALADAPYAITVRISQITPGTNVTTANSRAVVVDAPIVADPFSYALTGQTFSGFLATFFDTDPRSAAAQGTGAFAPSRYRAVIDWDTSDGDPSTEPVEVLVNTDGGYLVRGTHGYRLTGRYNYALTIRDVVGRGPGKTVSGTIEVPPASLNISVSPPAAPVEGRPFAGAIARFVSTNPNALAADYSAAVSWGDGTTTPSAQVVPARDAGGAVIPGSFDVLGGDKTYALVGSYPVAVTVRLASAGGSEISATAEALVEVADAPLEAAGVALPAGLVTKTDLAGLVVATFVDTGLVSVPGDFSASVAWGDGTTGPAVVVPTGANTYLVQADHRFARPGTLAPVVTIVSRFGSVATATSQAVVAPKLTPVTGGLDSSAGPAAAQGVTRLGQPLIRGTAEPGAVVTLFVTSGTGQPAPIGTAVADSTGVWAATPAQPLAEGSYTLVASAVDAFGFPSSDATSLLPGGGAGPLIVDRTGPRVSRVAIDAGSGRVLVTLTDSGSGLLRSALADPSYYSLAIVGLRANRSLPLTGLALGPAQPETVQTATLTFGNVGRLARGTYMFRMNAPGLTDRAGNALDERFFVPFPGVYARPGQDFVAEFSTDGRVASPLRQFVPPPERAAARRFQEQINRLRRRG